MGSPELEPKHIPPRKWAYEFDDLSTVVFTEELTGIRGQWDTDLDADQAIAQICMLDDGENIMADFDLLTVGGQTVRYVDYMDSTPIDKLAFVRATSVNVDKDVIWRGGGEHDLRPGFDTWFADKKELMKFLRDTAASDITDAYEELEGLEG
ncbi:MAG: hypothetical protein ABIP74_03760 [Candidatus Saccharimonas sp.]